MNPYNMCRVKRGSRLDCSRFENRVGGSCLRTGVGRRTKQHDRNHAHDTIHARKTVLKRFHEGLYSHSLAVGALLGAFGLVIERSSPLRPVKAWLHFGGGGGVAPQLAAMVETLHFRLLAINIGLICQYADHKDAFMC